MGRRRHSKYTRACHGCGQRFYYNAPQNSNTHCRPCINKWKEKMNSEIVFFPKEDVVMACEKGLINEKSKDFYLSVMSQDTFSYKQKQWIFNIHDRMK